MFESQYDDLFVYAPSFLLSETQQLDEGKAIGTARAEDLMLVRGLVSYEAPEVAKKRVIAGQSMGRTKLQEIRERTEPYLLSRFAAFDKGKISEETLRYSVVKSMRAAWRDAFVAGVRASGYHGESAGKGKIDMTLPPGSDGWLRGAMAHESRFLNRFVSQVIEGSAVMPLPRRVAMYMRTLQSIYDSARVLGLPGNVALHWVGPHDPKSCKGCKYLFEHSPYSKFTLPTVPRAGLTPCLTGCRDRLLVRRVASSEVQEMAASGRSREQHVAALRRIKYNS